jgi:hypothetical protein
MAKLTLTELQIELSRRLKQVISSTDTTTLNSAIARSVRTIDSLASYTFLQKFISGTIISGTDNISAPNDLNLNKEIKMYLTNSMIMINYVPYTELKKYEKLFNTIPSAFAYYYDQSAPKFYFPQPASINIPYYLYYSKIMTVPSISAYAEIPEPWYDLILDVAEYQQKSLYGLAFADAVKLDIIDRLKNFVREYNASQGAIININDEIIRKGG